MIKIEHIDVVGWEHAVRGMRNPMNSWDKSDSGYVDGAFLLGPADLGLMHRLYTGGTEHRKYMRMIVVYMDVTAPLYWWKEFDTYKVGTVANSCSTMHKIHSRPLTLDDFSTDHLNAYVKAALEGVIDDLNVYRWKFLDTTNKEHWWQMIQLLPTSYNQRRTVMMNYEVASTIIRQRTGHELDEWHVMVDTLNDLPYMQEIVTGVVR